MLQKADEEILHFDNPTQSSPPPYVQLLYCKKLTQIKADGYQ